MYGFFLGGGENVQHNGPANFEGYFYKQIRYILESSSYFNYDYVYSFNLNLFLK